MPLGDRLVSSHLRARGLPAASLDDINASSEYSPKNGATYAPADVSRLGPFIEVSQRSTQLDTQPVTQPDIQADIQLGTQLYCDYVGAPTD